MSDDLSFQTAIRSLTIFVTLMFFIFGLLIIHYTGNITQLNGKVISDYHQRVYREQLINNPECFAYENEETGRIDLNIIDKEKLTAERLENCLQFGTQAPYTILPAKIIVSYNTLQESIEIQTSTWNGFTIETKRTIQSIIIQNGSKKEFGTITIATNKR